MPTPSGDDSDRVAIVLLLDDLRKRRTPSILVTTSRAWSSTARLT
jgi:hypothetical protein